MSLRLNVIVASTRPGRVGPSVANWFKAYAAEKSPFDVHLVDLAEFDLPVYDEPKHPRMQDYQNDHTKKWSESVAAADAFVFVTPEYNYHPTPALVNALTYVSKEWGYKPASFVSYGGVSGGTRAVDQTRTWFPVMKMMAVPEQVMCPMVFDQIKDGVFEPNKLQVESADLMLSELHRWAEALKPLRG
ncbi:NADPH-dependent FMN reductase [Amorphus orientalis]|uniref:NAD(P)H-dependent FMN reductase n=1 Tax=Amorphus orientalis TaxID=649198 RepID=A0AAE4ARF6_9HYPH|nr:NAD(P)H-dependent oxidoreductase [Amorphus orientalis]MDQ0313800.1 NAD(P)H-dependent FMN reductase [Amorphus orientalis]